MSGIGLGGGEGSQTTLARRDAEAVRLGLERWLPRGLGGAGGAVVSNLIAPSGAGFSNETYVFDVVWEGGAEERLVVQAAPMGDALFQRYDLRKMFDLQLALGQRGVPTAPMRGYEDDGFVLGSPFYVMDYVAGRVPADNPPYVVEGFVVQATPEQRAAMWWSTVEAMATLHRVDPDDLSPQLRESLGAGRDPVEEKLAFWDQFVRWASHDELPLHDEALGWLRAHRPEGRLPLSVLWGDPKLANVVYQDWTARAVLDWELCGVGYAEEDVAAFLWMAHYAAAGAGAAPLDGIPGPSETIERYGALLGRPLEQMDWWWVFSVFRLSAICHRIMHQVRALGGLPVETNVGAINPITGLLRQELDRVR